MAKKTEKSIDFISPVEQSAITRKEKQEETRSKIALYFIYGYLIVIAGLITLTTFYKLMPETAKDYLLTISSPLGFIIGYYFKGQGDE